MPAPRRSKNPDFGTARFIYNKRRPYYRNLPPLLETFGVMAVVPAFIIGGETAGRSNKTIGEWTTGL